MRVLPPTPTYTIFVDTSAIYSTKAIVEDLPDSVPDIANLHYFVPELVVEERARQLMDELADLRQRCALFANGGIAVNVPPEPNLKHLRAVVQRELKRSLKYASMEVLEPIAHRTSVQVTLFEARYKGAYKDTILFDLAVEAAERKGLSNCIFVTKDKGFSELARLLRSNKAFEFQSLADLRERLRFDQRCYGEIINSLYPKFRDRVLSLRSELVSRGRASDSVFGPIDADTLTLFRREDFDSGGIEVDVRDLSLSISDDESNCSGPGAYQPTQILCGMTVRLATHRWARLYTARGAAKLKWSGKKLESGEVIEFELYWSPFA